MTLPELVGVTSTATAHGEMEFFTFDDTIGHALNEYGEWAANEIGVLSAFIGPGNSVLDIGANVGAHALAFAHRVGPTGSVIAIEPQQAVFNVLARNFARNGLVQARAIRAAVGAEVSELAIPPVDYAGHANIGAVALRPVAEAPTAERVPVLPIDALDLKACHLVKVDVEGLGAEVLAGGRTTILRLRPVIAAECNSVTEGVALMQVANWPEYDFFLLRASAFNAENFKRSSVNIFGGAHETAILMVPRERRALTPTSRSGAAIIGISGLDQMAAAFLATSNSVCSPSSDGDLATLRQELTDAQQRLGQAERDLAAARLELAIMRASSSWRITAPLRRLVQLVRRDR